MNKKEQVYLLDAVKIHNKLNPEIHNKLLILGFIRVNPKRCNSKNTEINV